MQPEQQRVMGYFIEEAKEHLNTIEQGLLNLQSIAEEPEMLNEVFRAAHSVKGGAAMLGLYSIQQTAHCLEDYFKVLKEHRVKVDQKLESLFFQGFDTLQELLEELQSPLGLTDDVAENVTEEFQLISAELNTHLAALVSHASEGATTGKLERSVEPKIETPSPKPEDDTTILVFQNDVPAKLREMLQLFKQADNLASRQKLQEICQSLAQVGKQFNLPNWSKLTEIAQLAITNRENSYAILAPILIKEIKAGRDLVLAGDPAKIIPSQQLTALVPQALTPDPEAEPEDQQVIPTGVEIQPDVHRLAEANVGHQALSQTADSRQAETWQSPGPDKTSAYSVAPDLSLSQASTPSTSTPATSLKGGMAGSQSSAELFEEVLPELEPDSAEIVDNSNAVTFTSNNDADVEISSQDLSELFGAAISLDDTSNAAQETDFASLFDGEPDNKTQETKETENFLPFSVSEVETESSQAFQLSRASQPPASSEAADSTRFEQTTPSTEVEGELVLDLEQNSSEPQGQEGGNQVEAAKALEFPVENLDVTSTEPAEPRPGEYPSS